MKSPGKGPGPEPSKGIEAKPPVEETVVQTAASAAMDVSGPLAADPTASESLLAEFVSEERSPAGVKVYESPLPTSGLETMTPPPTAPHLSPFEAVKQLNELGQEFWSSRDMFRLLGYLTHRNFEPVIEKAKIACKESGNNISDHFADVRNMIPLGKGARRSVEGVALSRYACYLIIQNADPSKDTVAAGQTYFAVQTRRQELADQGDAQANEDRRRLVIRSEVREHNVKLADAAKGAGVVKPIDYAVFQNHGYMGLYGGLGAKAIHTRKGLTPGQEILDHMGSSELAANLFRATQAEEKLRREGITGKANANRAHEEVGKKVRQTIVELGGTLPEDHPPVESIKVLEARERQANKRGKGSGSAGGE